jgi:hypothetical protein
MELWELVDPGELINDNTPLVDSEPIDDNAGGVVSILPNLSEMINATPGDWEAWILPEEHLISRKHFAW